MTDILICLNHAEEILTIIWILPIAENKLKLAHVPFKFRSCVYEVSE